MKLLKSIIATLCAIAPLLASAQGTSYYDDPTYDRFQRQLYFVGKNRPITGVRQYKMDELRQVFNPDSVLYDGINTRVSTRLKIFNNIFNDNFLTFRSQDSTVEVHVNPLFNFEVGKDFNQDDTHGTYINSRGLYLDGHLGKNFWFYVDFIEEQSDFARYYNHLTDSLGVVPGLSRSRNNSYYDYEISNGYIAFNVGEYVDIQIGKYKTFLGDGYRSLLLSDAAVALPSFKMNLRFLGAKYMFLMTQARQSGKSSERMYGKFTRRAKYCFSHYLEWNMGRRFTLGVFENVTQASYYSSDSTYRAPDIDYIMPFSIFRPSEFNAGSPDKMLVGATAKFICTNWLTIYGQFVLNEFRIKELLSGNNWWANKYGFQIGSRLTNIFKLNGLDLQFEYNAIRPYVYSQYTSASNYTHLGQCLAHPAGANLREGIAILTYQHGRWRGRLQLNKLVYGDDYKNSDTSYGHNPNVHSNLRPSDYGIKTLQGLKTEVRYLDAQASFIINPRNMMNLTLGLRTRSRSSDQTDELSKHVYFALRWSLMSRYYDF